MVEKNPAGGEDIIGFTVVDRHPVSVKFSGAIGAARIKGCVFRLRYLLCLAKHFRGGGLIKPNTRVDSSYSLQQVYGPQAGNFTGCNRLLEGYADKALGCQIVYFIRFDIGDQPVAT